MRWTDTTLVPGVTPIKGVHLTELRTALAEAYVVRGRPAPGYTDAAVTAEASAIKAVHVTQLRDAILALE